MTRSQKVAAFMLMQPGRYLMKSQGHPGFFTIYEGKQNPVRRTKVSSEIYKALKQNKKQQYTFNLSYVRQLHGKSYLNKIYKKLQKK